MSDDKSMSVKAYLVNSEGKEEVRRFGIPEGASTSFNYLQERIRTIFSLNLRDFILKWQDAEGDRIVISSDEELFEAIGECISRLEQPFLRIYVTVKSEEKTYTNKDESGTHFGVVCDGCNGKIVGDRYKCMACPDYDLCESCEAKGRHSFHEKMRIRFNKSPPNFPPFVEVPGFGANCEINAHINPHMGWQGGPRRHGHGGRFGGRGGGWKQWKSQDHPTRNDNHWSCNAKEKERKASTESKEKEKQCPFNEPPPQYSASQNGAEFQFPFMAFGTGLGGSIPPNMEGVSSHAQKIAEEASQFATQMASKHMADIMKGIWTAWSGNSGATSTADGSAKTSSEPFTSGDARPMSASNPGINIEIEVEGPETCQPTSGGNSEMQEKETEMRNESSRPQSENSMDVDPQSQTEERSSPVGGEEWTLLNRDVSPEVVVVNEVTTQLKNTQVTPNAPVQAPTAEESQNANCGSNNLYPNLDSAQPASTVRGERNATEVLHPNERVRNALKQMESMGYSNEGGWLTRLLEMKDGDINQVLDLLLVRNSK